MSAINLLTLVSDQERISPYEIKTVESRQEMRMKKLSINGLFVVDPIPNSPNLHHRNCVADSKENY